MLTRACAEYINEIASWPGAPPVSNFTQFMREAERNIDFGYVCHWAADAGFMCLDFKQVSHRRRMQPPLHTHTTRHAKFHSNLTQKPVCA